MTSETIQWGDSADDVQYVVDILEGVLRAGDRASVATEEADRDAFFAELRGAATMLGLVVPQGADVAAALRALLFASRDEQGEVSEQIIQAARGASGEARAAAHRRASQHSGRRGLCDNAVYQIDRGLRGLESL